ncbi:aryldialkylphosphatase [Kineococcus sp. R8]|uniref:phosphotriesterase family protein n=1 Tax=Kineococcus siccus TaxID=2696567 RepID=UPI0014136EBC|nr:aryldialkylphosphatase [Kineococcus siccus]NAZ83199.1 aryldialkylphosphatase [Kineococcus siccus]
MNAHPLVRTVTGDLPAAQLGRTDAHEHVFLASPQLAGEEFQDPSKAAEELHLVRASGIDAVVDLTTIGLGRRPADLAAVSAATGVHVVAATGYHRDAHYRGDHWVQRATREQLLRAVVADVRDGMDASDWTSPFRETSPARAGIIKAGASYQRISRGERLRLEVCVEAAVTTGVALAVHTEVGTAGPDVLDVAEAGGLPASRVLLAHLDRNPDVEAHADLVQRGAVLVYDTVGRIKYRPDSVLLDLCEQMLERGHGASIVLGTDVGRRSMLRSHGGGPGMDVLGREFLPRLRRRVGEHAVTRLLVDTPARFLALQGDAP